MSRSRRSGLAAAISSPPVIILMWACLLAGCATVGAGGSHAVADDWIPAVAAPEFPRGQGPLVLVDAAHGNWHTIEGRFRGFADLLEADGYRLQSARLPVTERLLNTTDVFVVANAVRGGEDSEWVLPTPPAFDPAEVAALEMWVRTGGSLLLIADHMPFPGSVADLADCFGIVFHNGFAKPSFSGSGTLLFTRETGTLAEHPITAGRTESERVVSVKSFTGQAFRLYVPGEFLLRMPQDWIVLLPQDAFARFDATTPHVSARGLAQGAVLRHGAGHVAVFGEAAMFTAQAIQDAEGNTVRIGMSDPEAVGNAQFVLNVMHWLSAQRGASVGSSGPGRNSGSLPNFIAADSD